MGNKLLYIAREPQSLNSGGSSVDQRNLRILQSIYGFNNVLIEYLPKTTLKTVFNSMLSLSSYGVSRSQERKILQIQRENKCEVAFIEGSFCGRLVRELGKQGCNVIIHMHNVEVILYKDRLKTEKNLTSFIKYLFIQYNEKESIKHAYSIINLNNRDSEDMCREYGRRADLILPITFPKRILSLDYPHNGNYLLFVGSNFFPNIEGILWFFSNVAPYIRKKIKIVGSCCKNQIFTTVSIPKNVELVGYVDNLEEYYLNASAVIAPIFHGSGMKTKTIEAMSYAKTIIGTDEAFVGIDNPDKTVGCKCNTAKEFIEAINNLDNRVINTNTLKTFEDSYTDEVFRTKLITFLDSIEIL